MIACIDVHYADTHSAAACVLFAGWQDAAPSDQVIHIGPKPLAYEPGAFYRRELPNVLAVLNKLNQPPEVVIVDSYVWLGPDRKGMGAYVYQATRLPVIGVAKRGFSGATPTEVLRGDSERPLYVTTAGYDVALAAEHIRSMHGPFRMPTLLKCADRLCRDALVNPSAA